MITLHILVGTADRLITLHILVGTAHRMITLHILVGSAHPTKRYGLSFRTVLADVLHSINLGLHGFFHCFFRTFSVIRF